MTLKFNILLVLIVVIMGTYIVLQNSKKDEYENTLSDLKNKVELFKNFKKKYIQEIKYNDYELNKNFKFLSVNFDTLCFKDLVRNYCQSCFILRVSVLNCDKCVQEQIDINPPPFPSWPSSFC